MDGTSQNIIHNAGLSAAYGLTMDYDTQTLYWIDDGYNRIEGSKTDGGSRTVLTSSNVYYPRAITYYGGKVYWTDQYYDGVYYASVSYPHTAVKLTSLTNPYGITITSEDRQPEGIFYCACMYVRYMY